MMLDLTLTDGEREAAVGAVMRAWFPGVEFDPEAHTRYHALAGFAVVALTPLLLRAGAVKGIEASARASENAFLLHDLPDSRTGPFTRQQEAADEARVQIAAAIRSLTPPSTEETTPGA